MSSLEGVHFPKSNLTGTSFPGTYIFFFKISNIYARIRSPYDFLLSKQKLITKSINTSRDETVTDETIKIHPNQNPLSIAL